MVMQNKLIAIGTNIANQKYPYTREIHYAGKVEDDEEVNGLLKNKKDEGVLVRHYSMFHSTMKFCVIQEYFSNEINKILSVSFV